MDWRMSGTDYVIRLDRGEEIMSSLMGLLEEQDIRSGSIVGIGAVEETVLGFYDGHTREYLRRSFPEEAELVVFAGNVSVVDGAPFVHAHAVISDASFQAFSGHFFSGIISVTGEFQLRANPVSVHRELDAGFGLKLLRFE
ncbi:MAG: PPC domain-containing DNA-binding protein [Pseudomonadota bacterium]